MNEQQQIDYDRIAHAIAYISRNFKHQPDLQEIAAEVHLSPFHFQRMFGTWAGTTPKKFLQYISLGHARQLLADQRNTVFDAAFETGLSGTGRLHDLFISIEGMTPAEFRNGGKNLTIHYNFVLTPFGKLIVASTSKGICHMAFHVDELEAFATLQYKFPNATFEQATDALQETALKIFREHGNNLPRIKLHLKGTDFQLKVWEALLKIPMGRLSTYGHLASHIGSAAASRAVGTAIGQNPVAFLVPCHRVIQSTGHFGGYMWGGVRKTAIIGWEQARADRASE